MKKAFFDTNIVVYYYTSTEPEKRQSAASILLQSQGIISTQVLNELSNVLSKKYHFSWTEISSVTEDLSGNFEVKVVNEAIITKAIACAKNIIILITIASFSLQHLKLNAPFCIPKIFKMDK